MTRKLPMTSKRLKICIICEGDEEKNSNFMNLITWLSSKDSHWIEDLQKLLDIYD